MEPTIPDAPPALKAFLARLPHETGGFVVSQHANDPQPDEWYVGWESGDIGPYATAEAALFAGIRWLRGHYDDASAARDAAEVELARRSERCAN